MYHAQMRTNEHSLNNILKQKLLSDCQEALHCVGNRALVQAAQRL